MGFKCDDQVRVRVGSKTVYRGRVVGLQRPSSPQPDLYTVLITDRRFRGSPDDLGRIVLPDGTRGRLLRAHPSEMELVDAIALLAEAA